MLNARRVKNPVVQPFIRVEHGEPCSRAEETCNANSFCPSVQQEEEEKEEEDRERGILVPNSIKHHDMSNNRVLVGLMASLKACIAIKDIEHGIKIHACVIREGLLERDTYIGSALINMYAKCGALTKAQEVFKASPTQNVASWNALIAGYAQHGHAEKALSYSVQMEASGLSPNAITFVCILKACGSIGDSIKGQEIHAQIERERLGNNIVVANALIDMYAKCGLLTKAQEILDKLPVSDVISWTALVTGYTQYGHSEEALKCFERMQAKGSGTSPNAVTLLCILKACGSAGSIDKGHVVHDEIVKKGFLLEDVVMSNTLVDMYAKCGVLEEAHNVFSNLSYQDAVSWNALIAGYVRHAHFEKALNCYEEMRSVGLFPDAVTFACILKACSSVGAIGKGQYLHVEISKGGLLEKDIVVGAALLDMYSSCGILEKAQEVFDELPFRNVILWTALIAGYSQHGHCEDALACFEQMQLGGFVADAVTFMCILQACGSLGAAEKGREIHAQIVREGVLERDMVVGTALVDMYISCNMLLEAQELFVKHTVRDVVAYNVLITRFAQRSYGEAALKLSERMQLEGLIPDQFTLVSILKACGSLGAAYKGQETHSTIIRLGLLNIDIVVATALVDMYTSCGMLAEAQNMFDKLCVQDLVTSTLLMAGYAQLGMDVTVFNLFDRMLKESKEPTVLTFTIMLSTCSHTGLLDQGYVLFEMMRKVFGILPTPEHYNCMVDLLSRAGCLDKAVALTNDIPFSSDLTAWHTVLGFCHILGALKLGKLAFDHATQMDEKHAAAYVCMSNILCNTSRA